MTSESAAQPMNNPRLPLPELYEGKVRHIYKLGIEEEGKELLLLVASDRISAFDVVLPTLIPHKGEVLTRMSAMWFEQTKHIAPNHFIDLVDENWLQSEFARMQGLRDILAPVVNRAMIVQRAERIDIECIVRGYITGSAWTEYSEHGTVARMPMPKGLLESSKFPEPLFTPTTKAEVGHDESMTAEEVITMVGAPLARQLEGISKAVYRFGHNYAQKQGIVLADTKMEFGLLHGQVILIDELFTPDSSRFWDLDGYQPGQSQPSFDKQFVRDWLIEQGWDRKPPAPKLPFHIVQATSQKYLEAWDRLKNA